MTANFEFIPVNTPKIYGDELTFLTQSVNEGWISSESPYVERFEKGISTIANRKFGTAVSNGTAALEIAIRAIGIMPGDEVIIPAFTIISCAQAITKVGAIPVLVDANPTTWNMDESQIRSRITPRTKAIMLVHIYGLPSNVIEIMKIANEFGLMVIEDAAEAIGLEIDGKPCGSFGDVSTMSFYANKHITTGEGGIVLTNSTKIEERSKYLRNLCFDSERRFKHDEIGWNYRMSGLQAAFGLGQIMNLRETIQRKTEIGALYQELFSTETRFLKPVEKSLGSNNIYWVFAVVLDPSLGLLASTVIDQMHKQGVGCRPFFFPMHKQPVFINDGLFEGEHYPVAETLSDFGLYLPSGTSTTNEQIRFSAEILIKTLDSLDV